MIDRAIPVREFEQVPRYPWTAGISSYAQGEFPFCGCYVLGISHPQPNKQARLAIQIHGTGIRFKTFVLVTSACMIAVQRSNQTWYVTLQNGNVVAREPKNLATWKDSGRVILIATAS